MEATHEKIDWMARVFFIMLKEHIEDKEVDKEDLRWLLNEGRSLLFEE